jgi:hypothetical protein
VLDCFPVRESPDVDLLGGVLLAGRRLPEELADVMAMHDDSSDDRQRLLSRLRRLTACERFGDDAIILGRGDHLAVACLRWGLRRHRAGPRVQAHSGVLAGGRARQRADRGPDGRLLETQVALSGCRVAPADWFAKHIRGVVGWRSHLRCGFCPVPPIREGGHSVLRIVAATAMWSVGCRSETIDPHRTARGRRVLLAGADRPSTRWLAAAVMPANTELGRPYGRRHI